MLLDIARLPQEPVVVDLHKTGLTGKHANCYMAATGGCDTKISAWRGCRVIADGDVFVMNWQSPDSLDGRYFGQLPASAVIGKAVPIWTDEE